MIRIGIATMATKTSTSNDAIAMLKRWTSPYAYKGCRALPDSPILLKDTASGRVALATRSFTCSLRLGAWPTQLEFASLDSPGEVL